MNEALKQKMDELAKKYSGQEATDSDAALWSELNRAFQAGFTAAVEEYDQLLADARELQKALEIAKERCLDWDLIYTQHSKQKLQDWRGKCLDAIETFTKKYGEG